MEFYNFKLQSLVHKISTEKNIEFFYSLFLMKSVYFNEKKLVKFTYQILDIFIKN